MMMRCKPLLGTFVEIVVDQEDCQTPIDRAFSVIQKIQELMVFITPIAN
jgi:thiamine biosynthesis lipoprotein